MKRVASATGEGASVVSLVHAWLEPAPVVEEGRQARPPVVEEGRQARLETTHPDD